MSKRFDLAFSEAERQLRATATERALQCQNPWESSSSLQERFGNGFERQSRHAARSMAHKHQASTESALLSWFCFLLTVALAILAVLMITHFDSSSGAVFLLFVSALSFVAWLKSLLSGLRTNREVVETNTKILSSTALETFLEAIEERKRIARTHTPGESSARALAPEPQPFGVSHQGAELLVCQWMKHLGENDAATTVQSGDGGVDVESLHYVAQVKHYTGSVSIESVRALAGVAAVDGRKCLFFTSGSYTEGSVKFANAAGMSLFCYSAEQGTLTPANPLAASLLRTGL